jgi:hypothetical protein
MRATANLPALLFSGPIPFNNLNVMALNIVAKAELHFYQQKRNTNTLRTDVLYRGIGCVEAIRHPGQYLQKEISDLTYFPWREGKGQRLHIPVSIYIE